MANFIYFSQNQQHIEPSQLLESIKPQEVPKFELFKKFLEYAFRRSKDNEFWQQNPSAIKNQLINIWLFILQRAPREIKINEVAESENTFIYISQEDAPYLVDSLQMALLRLRLDAHRMLSIGGLCVLRNSANELTDIILEEETPSDAIFEDPLLLHLSLPIPTSRMLEIKNHFLIVLQEAHLSYQDQTLMREKCQAIIDELTEHRRHVPSEEAREAMMFLKWLLEEHFYFLGYREYNFNTKKELSIDLISGSGLGLLRDEIHAVKSRPLSSMPKEAQRLADPHFVLVVTKTNTKSRIHRDVYTDYISIKRFDAEGKITGEYRFIGLFHSSAYHESIKQIPYLRRKMHAVLALSKIPISGHLGKLILTILENFPRDDMFQMTPEELYKVVRLILKIRTQGETRLLVRKDAYARFYSCYIFLPKHKITADLCEKFQQILSNTFHSTDISMSMQLQENVLGRLYFVIRIPPEDRSKEDLNFPLLEEKIIAASKTWEENLKELLTRQNAKTAEEIFNRYRHAFNLAYQAEFTAEETLPDIQYIEEIYQMGNVAIHLYPSQEPQNFYLKLYQPNQPSTLSEIIPMLENMGLEALREDAYKCKLKDKTIWICCYELRIQNNATPNLFTIKPLFADLFFALREKRVENDKLNALVLKCALPWHLIAVLRAYCSYMRLTGVYSQAYLEKILNENALISKKLLQFFVYRFDLQNAYDAESITIKAELKKALTEVRNLEEDKILRAFLALMEATVRTNYYQMNAQGQHKNYLSLKFQSGKIPNLPLPHPLYEIFVYSPHFEAIHLRAAKVARGGIRWSDRLEDFRTEVLGLMKAQQVKNAVIVPAGSKGGFILKQNTTAMDRNQLQQEAIACYQDFMRSLLDLTDNLIDGKVVPPEHIKRYDDDDPYLVVAADKGTATFSDYANQIAAEYHFWLGDAFASGGSQGYDHKRIGITAKGAWISVETHLKTLGINPKRDAFTAVGIGDMSGDVFGNGMLLSKKIKLLAAFNHLHIFVDPNPDPEKSFEERQRLFNLPRSTWLDYSAQLISKGGGVFNRNAKSITLSPEIKALFYLKEDEVEPTALIRAILKAKVDLLFNGGIGTYVKSSRERNQDVGDKTNDGVRVDANELQCRCVGEGGNLGFTQLARVEYAEKSGLIFTDFIDNSAGVDLSDHEVNIKILLAQALNKNLLAPEKRNSLLSSMTEDVAKLVLKDNKEQTEVLSYARAQATHEAEIYSRWIKEFEKKGILNRAVEFLPAENALEDRIRTGHGLTAPEIAVVMAYVKMDIKQALLKSKVLDQDYFSSLIIHEFPELLNKEFSGLMPQHRLHREIISTQLSNQMLNEAGVVFIQRLREETNANVAQVVCAYSIIRDVFDLSKLYQAVRELDYQVTQHTQHQLRKHLIRFLRRSCRWLIHHELSEKPIPEILMILSPIKAMLEKLPTMLCGIALEKYNHLIKSYTKQHVPLEIATQIATVYHGFLLLDINIIAQKTAIHLDYVAKIYFMIGQKLGLDWMRDEITNQPVINRWEALAHSGLRDRLDSLQTKITYAALKHFPIGEAQVERHITTWLENRRNAYEAWEDVLTQCKHAVKADYIMYSVALNTLNGLTLQLEEN